MADRTCRLSPLHSGGGGVRVRACPMTTFAAERDGECGQAGCTNRAVGRLHWPGRPPTRCCEECMRRADMVARSLGFEVRVEPLGEEAEV